MLKKGMSHVLNTLNTVVIAVILLVTRLLSVPAESFAGLVSPCSLIRIVLRAVTLIVTDFTVQVARLLYYCVSRPSSFGVALLLRCLQFAIAGAAAIVNTPLAGPVNAHTAHAAARSPAPSGIISTLSSRPTFRNSSVVSIPLVTQRYVDPKLRTYLQQRNAIIQTTQPTQGRF